MRHNKIIPAVCIPVLLLLGSSSSPVRYGRESGEAAEIKVVKEKINEHITAILGAFEQEIILLEDRLTNKQEQTIEEIRFVSGKLRGKKVVIAYTGIGKVNAAMTTTLLIEHFKPDKVIFTGIAGGVNRQLQPGDIVIAEKTAHHDMGTFWPEGLFHKGVKNRLSGWENPVFFNGDEQLIKLADRAIQHVDLRSIRLISGQRSPKVVKGVVVTGDSFIASAQKCAELRKKLNADAVEMEGAAVTQLCFQRGIGCLVIRSISDNADEGAVLDKQTFYLLAAQNSSSLVIEMLGLSGTELSSEQDAGSNKLKD